MRQAGDRRGWLRPERFGAWLASTRLVPATILASGVFAAAVVLWVSTRGATQLRQRLHEENRVRLRSTVEHMEDHFDAIYSTLLFISLDENVRAMRKGSEAFIQRLYDHQWEKHRLAEVYVIEKDFAGTTMPFLTFEHGTTDASVEDLHNLARELEEYERT